MLNVELMRHPANWVVVTLMVILASMMLSFLTKAATT